MSPVPQPDRGSPASRPEDAHALLACIVESSQDAIISIDLDGHILSWNPAAERLFGYGAADVVGRPVTFLSPPDARSDTAAIVERARRGEHIPPYETVRLRRDGRLVHVHVTASAVRDPAGRVIGLAATYRDITDRRKAEGDLRDARADAERGLARLRAVVGSMADGLVVAAADGILVEWNPAALRLHGFASEDEVRKPLADFAATFVLAPPGGPPVPLEDWPMTRVLRGETLSDVELHVRRLDIGLELVISYSGAPVRGPTGAVELGVLTLHDVTQRRRLEAQYRQAQRLEAVGQLAGGIAHDFNNLLTVINGFSDVALETLRPDDPAREFVGEVRKAGERAAGLTRQLLAFSRQQVLSPRVLDLNGVVSDMGKMLRRLLGEDVEVVTELRPGLWPVHADPGQLEQVLLNLAVNARDAMPDGGKLAVRTRNEPREDGSYVMLEVADTGVGMTDAVRARIFEPFFTTKGPGKGTGLGLAVVHGIVEQAGGFVEVDSEVGRGTTFRVYLPRTREPAGGGRPSDCGERPRGTESVLVAEDEPGVRALAGRVLRGCGYTVLEAADADEALRAVGRHTGRVDLLVTDVVMPGLSGRDLAGRLRAAHPGLRVLYLSGYTDDAVVRRGVAADRVHFLQKPFTAAALARKVREVLDAPG